jgi:hypothetical protein
MSQKTRIIKPTIYFLFGIFLCLSALAEDTKSVEVMDGCPRLTYKNNESYQMFLDRIQVEHGNITAQIRANGYESEISRIENNIKTGVMSDLKYRSLSKAEIKSCKNLVVKYKKMVQDFYEIPIVDNSCSRIYAGKPVTYTLRGCAFYCEVRAVVIGIGSGVASVKSEDGEIREKNCSELH